MAKPSKLVPLEPPLRDLAERVAGTLLLLPLHHRNIEVDVVGEVIVCYHQP